MALSEGKDMTEMEGVLLRIVNLIQEDPELHRAVVSLLEALAADRLMASKLKQLRIERIWAGFEEKGEKRP
jgi:hypothetical protein